MIGDITVAREVYVVCGVECQVKLTFNKRA